MTIKIARRPMTDNLKRLIDLANVGLRTLDLEIAVLDVQILSLEIRLAELEKQMAAGASESDVIALEAQIPGGFD